MQADTEIDALSKLRVVKEIPEARIHEWLGEGQDQ